MAAKKKAAKAGAVAAAPYVQRVISDEELRENVRSAIESAREAFARLSNGKGPAKTVLDDKKFHRSVAGSAVALKIASDALREAPKRQSPKKRKRRLGRKLMILVVGAGIALAVSEDLRNKVLDQLFGKEEEFEYTSNTAPSTPPPAASKNEPAAAASSN